MMSSTGALPIRMFSFGWPLHIQPVCKLLLSPILMVPCSCRMSVKLTRHLGCSNYSGGFAAADESFLCSLLVAL